MKHETREEWVRKKKEVIIKRKLQKQKFEKELGRIIFDSQLSELIKERLEELRGKINFSRDELNHAKRIGEPKNVTDELQKNFKNFLNESSSLRDLLI